jgi:hypothetical protein
MTSYLLVIGEREALAWILRESRMAFPATRRPEVDALTEGDELFLLTTRGCFHNPTRDRTRIIGRATARSAVSTLHEPVELVGRSFPRGCRLTIDSLAPYLDGLELAPLVAKLRAFDGTQPWAMRLRRTLVPLTTADAALLRPRLASVAGDVEEHRETYLESIRPVTVSGR